MLDRALRAGREAVAASGRAGEFAGVGVTGQQHGMVLVSTAPEDDLRPLTPLIGWQDKRGDEPAGGFPSTIAWMQHLLAGTTTERTGCRIASGFMGATLFWLARQGQLPTAAGRATFMPDYLVARLCAQPPVTDPTDAGGAGLFDVVARRWDADLLAALDLPADLLPPAQPSGTLAGRLSGDAAHALGLPTGLPVMNAIGDNQASFFGSVGSSTADVLVNVGTGGQISAIREVFVRGQFMETRPYLDETYLLVGGGIIGGRSYAVLRDFIRQIGRDCFGVEGPDELYPTLNTLAASAPPGAEGLRCDPRFGSNRFDPDQRGSITGLDGRNFTPANLARALLEGMARTFHDLYGNMLAVGLAPRTRLVGAGNGIRRNPLLIELLSDAFALPLVTPRHTEEAAHGAAMLAAVSTRELSLAEATARLAYQDAR
jgi:sugar (pentulose or hexulose) kinase